MAGTAVMPEERAAETAGRAAVMVGLPAAYTEAMRAMEAVAHTAVARADSCLLYTSPSPRD